MKLNEKYLAVQFETNRLMKDFYLKWHLDMKHYLAAPTAEWWETRKTIAHGLTHSPSNMKIFYLTQAAQSEAEMIKYDKIDLKWFKQIANGHYMYVTGVNDFFRIWKTDERVNILTFFYKMYEGQLHLWYDSYSILLDKGEFGMIPSQDQERGHKIIKLLLFVELGEVSVKKVQVQHKIKYGERKDENIYNDSGLDNVYLVTSNWNKIVVVEGGFKVRGHLRVQPVGTGRSYYKLVWVREYEKGSYVRKSGNI